MIPKKVAILDAGSQYGKLIDRRIRELSICSEILPLDIAASELIKQNFKAIVISGSPGSVLEENAPNIDHEVFQCGLPVMAICYGMQYMNKLLGGSIERKPAREDGQFSIKLDLNCKLFKGLKSDSQEALLTHGDSISDVAPTFKVVAKSGNIIAGIANESRNLYGLQFHPEVDLTTSGKEMFETFLTKIANLAQDFTVVNREQTCIDEIKKHAGSSKVLVLVSGGIDSSVLAALCYKALPREQVIALHVDNGFMRKNESESVVEALNRINIDCKLVNAQNFFFNSAVEFTHPRGEGGVKIVNSRVLSHTIAPEEKRKIIGDSFMRVIDFEAAKLDLTIDHCFLAQGTLRPDLIESASDKVSKQAEAIKTHHNDTYMVRLLRKQGRIIEPLSDFHKDEVRELGRNLGLPGEIVMRHPFPGPGLSIRVICAEDPFTCAEFSQTQTLLRLIADYSNSLKKPHALLQKVNAALSDEEKLNLQQLTSIFQMSALLLPIKSVGVQGDGRSYSYVAALSSPQQDANWNVLMSIAKIIPRICHNVNRVTYVFGTALKDPIQDITSTLLSPTVLSTLRQCDHLAHKVLRERGLLANISQMPVVLIPVHFDRDPIVRPPSCQRSVVLRPFISRDFMTGKPAMPGQDLPIEAILQMVRDVKTVPGISRVLYDLSAKPPGTTEWE